jgi:hypothetical protein
MTGAVRVLGLTAAVLLAGALGVASGYAAAQTQTQQETIRHTCSAADKKFIREARLSMTAVGSAGREYLAGVLPAPSVLADIDRAEARIKRTKPSDPVLSRTRLIMAAMLREYGGAIEAHAESRDAGTFMYRAYGLVNFAHDLLLSAEPELRRRGCEVSGLL